MCQCKNARIKKSFDDFGESCISKPPIQPSERVQRWRHSFREVKMTAMHKGNLASSKRGNFLWEANCWVGNTNATFFCNTHSQHQKNLTWLRVKLKHKIKHNHFMAWRKEGIIKNGVVSKWCFLTKPTTKTISKHLRFYYFPQAVTSDCTEDLFDVLQKN